MPAIASIEDLRAAQKDLLAARDLDELKEVFRKWRRIGWKNVCKIWLEERTPEQLKGENNPFGREQDGELGGSVEMGRLGREESEEHGQMDETNGQGDG